MQQRLSRVLRSERTLHIAEAIFVSPIFTAVQIRELAQASRAVVYRALKTLEADGLIHVGREGGGPKPPVWIYPELFETVK